MKQFYIDLLLKLPDTILLLSSRVNVSELLKHFNIIFKEGSLLPYPCEDLILSSKLGLEPLIKQACA
jgi:hypothetical protein